MKKIFCFLFVLLFVPVFSFSESDFNPVGRWTIESSTYSVEMGNNYMFGKTDFFIFEDGSVFRVSITKNRKDHDLTIGYDSGIWLCDKKELILRVGNDTFKCSFENDECFAIHLDDSDIKFVRVGG